ncbi:MAG: alpha/beta hydrolase [Chloroflexota bacterium]|nr:alpha/beta hydrolase [Chloroflexota bacterium]
MKLIFIHGSGNTKEVWHYQVKYFSGAEAVSLPGHASPGEPCTSVEDYVDWLHNYITEHKYSHPVLVGHSLGSAICQLYTLEHPQDITGLILIGAGARLRVAPEFLSVMQEGTKDYSSWLKNFIQPRYSRVAPEVSEKVIAKIAEVGPAVQLNDMFCCDKFDIMDKIDQIQVPTLIICGSEDEMTPPKYASYLAAKIKGAKLILIDAGTHLVFTEQPRAVNQAIEQFLNSLEN